MRLVIEFQMNAANKKTSDNTISIHELLSLLNWVIPMCDIEKMILGRQSNILEKHSRLVGDRKLDVGIVLQ